MAQQDWSLTFRGSSVPCPWVPRWRVMPQGHPQSPHTTRISRTNVSPSLPNSTTFRVLWHQLPAASSSLHPQGEGTIPRVGSQIGTCRNPWPGSGRKAPSAGHVTPWQMLLSPCSWASASHKTNHLRVKVSLGHWSSWNRYGDTTPCWPGMNHKKRGTLRTSASENFSSIRALRCMNTESQL